ncbi:hypothetical protein EB001_11150 [bacterium]|nr:hypothetical protein [bacterium]
MKWFDRWFAKKVKWAWDNHNQITVGVQTLDTHGAIGPLQARNSYPSKDYVDFKLWFADNGGYIVEFNKYDRFKDRNNSQIYIIPDGLDTLGAELTEIVTQYVISNR